ncbi:MAG: type VI secretion system tip protein TssI/VgrG [Pyrinomonadaceae bacterium]
MGNTTQKNRLMSIATPLGEDYLLINRISATEGLSRLFSFEIELLHEEDSPGYEPTVVKAESMLGQAVTVSIGQRDGTERYFNGMVNQFSQGNRNTRFSFYYATVVPHVWILTQRHQSRIFQHKSVPEILKEVFEGFDVSYELQGDFKPRNYCVQYNETDFDFASRVMEEEGIYYFFEHTDTKHKMIIANTPQSHPDCPSKNEIPYFIKVERSKEDFITSIRAWQTDHKLQTGKVTLWDFHFQTPTNKLEAQQPSLFKVGDNQNMEIYQFPAGYARKWDDIDRGGGERSDVQNVFQDKQKIVEIAMQSLDARYKMTSAVSDCSSIKAGYKFKFTNHVDAGEYVITSVTHEAEQNPSYVTDDEIEQPYQNNFSCIAYGKGSPPFRPLRKTPKPLVQGSQTAIVVGPSGEEIFTDKFGRVKVQFHWDRDGQVNADSSCWIRVAQSWAGNKWGMMFIPRIGMEVLVHFLEGDPDQPIITGCVYNPETMPPYTLPDEKTKMTIKSDSSKGGQGFNEMRFEDKKGEEQIFFHAQKDMDIRVRNDRRELIGNDRHLIVNRDKRDRIKRDEHRIIERDQFVKIQRDYHRKIDGKATEEITQTYSRKVTGNVTEEFGANQTTTTTGNYGASAQMIVLEGQSGLTIKCGGNFITLSSAGIFIKGTMVMINSGGAALTVPAGNRVPAGDPQEAEIADNADPGSKSPTYKSQRRQQTPVQKLAQTAPWHKPDAPTNQDKPSWIEVTLEDEDGNPVPGERYLVVLPDGSTVASGTLDENGYAKISNIDPGNCKITFPDRDGLSWENK